MSQSFHEYRLGLIEKVRDSAGEVVVRIAKYGTHKLVKSFILLTNISSWQEIGEIISSLTMRLRRHNAREHGRAGQAVLAYCGEGQRKGLPRRRYARADKENVSNQRNLPVDLEHLEV